MKDERFGELAGFYLLAFIAVVLIADSFVSHGIFIVPAVFMTLIAAAYGLGLKARTRRRESVRRTP